jgi:D-serine deaminase-like pyridoxal phosphate-dependent protein
MTLSAKVSRVEGGSQRGSELSSVATPALVVDRATVERNIERLAAYGRAHGIGIRPHTKTHKSRYFAALQKEAGCIGLTAAKVGEAGVMAEVCDDVLLAYPALDPHRSEQAAQLAKETTLHVAIDSTVAADALNAAGRRAGSTIGILVDLDVGLHRTGVATPADALSLAQYVAKCANLRLDGIMCYPGHIWQLPDQQQEPMRKVSEILAETLRLWERNGLKAAIVSGGSTPTAYQSHLVPELTEIRPGTYLFNDMNTVRGGFCGLDDCAARIVCTVVSQAAAPDQLVIDAGSKTLTSDRCIPSLEAGYGHIVEYPEAVITRLSEEHGQVDVSRCGKRPRLGERVTVLPNHICPCVNLQDDIWLQEASGELHRLQVDARGMLV